MNLVRSMFSRAVILSAGIAVLACSSFGCAKLRKGSHLAKAARYYEAGEYERAEIEYKNVLQAEAFNADAIGQLGIIFFDEGRLSLAVPYLMKARDLKPDNLEVRRRLGTLFASFGRNKDAIEEARYILDRKPTDDTAPLILIDASVSDPEQLQAARTRLQQLPGGAAEGAPVAVALGLAELRQKNFDAAEAAFKRATSIDPRSAAAHSALAALYRAKKDMPNAEKELKTAAELSPIRSGKTLQYGQLLVQTGKAAEAKKLFDEVAKKAPDYIPVQLALAEIAAADKKYDEALALTTKVLSVDNQNPDALMLSGRLYLAQREPEKAVSALEKAARAYTNSPQLLYYLGLAYSASGDKQKAIEQLSKSVKIAPIPEVMIALAQLNLRKGDYGAVVLGLKPLVQQRPDNMQARLLLAEAYRGQGSFDDALALYRQSEKDFPNSPQASILSGVAWLQQKKPAEARKAFETALQRSPGFLPAIEQLMYLDLAEKRPDEAIARIEAALKNTPNSAGLHLLLAKALLTKNDTVRAEAELKRTIELAPNAAEPYLMLAGIYVTSGDSKKGLTNLQSAADKDPKDPKPVFLIGVIQDQQKNYAEARTAYEKVVAIDPKFSPALNNLAYLYSEQFNDLDKAYDAAQKAHELLPAEAHVADTLGWILYKKGQYARAASLLEESADKITDLPEIRYHLGVVQYALGQEDAAKVSLERAVEASPSSVWAQDAKRRLAALAIDPRHADESAVDSLEKLLAERPTDPVILARLATVYEIRNDLDKAIATYQTASKADPTSAMPQVNLARLYLAKKDQARALESARIARKLAPDDVNVGRSVGWLAYQAGDYSWAASLLQEAARKFESDPQVEYQAALATYSVGKTAEAESLMREALSPGSSGKAVGFLPGLNGASEKPLPMPTPLAEEAEARNWLNLVALASKPDSAQQSAIEAGLKKDVTTVPALMALGALQEQKADLTGARQSYERVLARFGEFAPAKLRLAVLAAAAPELDARALDWAQQARTAFPADMEAARALGILTVRKAGDPARAISLLRQSLAARPNDAEALYYLGLAQIQNKDQTGGRQSIQKAIAAGLRTDLAAEARKSMEAK